MINDSKTIRPFRCYWPTQETAVVDNRRTSSAVVFNGGLPVRSIASPGSTLATSTLSSGFSRTITLQGSMTPAHAGPTTQPGSPAQPDEDERRGQILQLTFQAIGAQ
jgi:hypothetical protein